MAEPLRRRTDIPAQLELPSISGATKANKGDAERPYYSPLEFSTRKKLYDLAVEFDEPIDTNPDKWGQIVAWAIENTELLQAEEVLETGCSGGDDLIDSRLQGIGRHSTGLDINMGIVGAADVKTTVAGLDNIDFVIGKVDELPFKPATFDAVFASYMMYEADSSSEQAVAQVWEAMKPNGLFLTTSHNDFNIPTIRNLELLVQEYSRGLTAPAIRSKQYWVDAAKAMLAAQGFEELVSFRGLGTIKIYEKDKDVFRDYFNTRQAEFQPQPSDNSWKRIMEKIIDPYIESSIRTRGFIQEYWDRWGGVYLKPLVEIDLTAEA